MIRTTIRVLSLCAVILGTPAFAAPACRGDEGYAADFGGRRTFRWKPQALEAAKADLGTGALAPAYKALLARADKALSGPLYAVTDKTRAPPGGDKHDYVSIGPYWWPDPSRPGGEPYVRRDGEVNPERNTEAFDAVRMDRMADAVEALSLAYYLTDDVRYAHKASALLFAWFLEPATRMRPSMTFAQGVPGRTPGRAEGVLDTYRLLRVVESIGLLAPSGEITPADQKALEAWFADYVSWLGTGPTALEERAAENNHGIWYDDQLATFALFARQPGLAKATIAEAARARIDRQIDLDGRMPKELARTRGLHYSYFALEPLVGLAELGPCVGVDLWNHKGPKGQGLRVAFAYLAPFVGAEARFPYQELKPEEATNEALPLYDLAAAAYDDPMLARRADVIAKRTPAALSRLVIQASGR